jgi:protein-tyrosine phosphatase/nicotinamidase-related amidase/thiamine kinase-like enzyme
MTHAILISQCLQNDFVKPIGPYDPLPNLLHIGHEEARRLMGEDPAQGPIQRVMQWAYDLPARDLSIVHIRDWHDLDDPFQTAHMDAFGPHCVQETDGCEFAFNIPDPDRQVAVFNAISINDFVGTTFGEYLQRFSGHPVNVGLIGVWTEAKVSFLAYELHTRFPNMRIGVCSALTASSSRSGHFFALGQLKRILGVSVFDSISNFTEFLTGESTEMALPVALSGAHPEIVLDGDDEIHPSDLDLIKYLFRDSKSVKLKALSGGFSGNLVVGSESVDHHGIQQVPHVVKIGPDGPIGQERTAFEQVEGVLGNNAPRIVDFADSSGRGALKYRYAAMGGGFSNTFQDLYCKGLDREKTEYFLNIVFGEQLGRFYKAAKRENENLLEHYGVDSSFAEPMRENIEAVLGEPANGETIRLPTGQEILNPYHFYKHDLPKLASKGVTSAYFSYVHGDLNGANIIIDTHENVWLIDFFHTGPGHVLKDLIKLENDILYIYTPVNNEEELAEACRLSDCLLRTGDLGRPLPEVKTCGLSNPELVRSYETIKYLRTFYPPLVHDDRNPLQLYIAQLRYAGHTLIFDESNHWQRLWALYTAGRCCSLLKNRLTSRGPLRVDWLDKKFTGKGKIGMTLLPGRKDYGRVLHDDIIAMQQQGVTHVLTMLTHNEFGIYGVNDLLDQYKEGGLVSVYFPILNQGVSSIHGMIEIVQWMDTVLEEGGNIMLHCVGGLGRSGLVAACYLVLKGMDAQSAIGEVRKARSPRAIESKVQEEFVHRFAEYETMIDD